jgi:MFS family permease
MNALENPLQSQAARSSRPTFHGVLPFYSVEAMATVGGTLMSVGIFYYMHDRFGWQMRQNFMLAAAQGILYVPAALLAGPVTAKFGQRRTLGTVYGALAIIGLMACLIAASGNSRSATLVALALLAYTFVIGLSWPILEGLVASGGNSFGLARRVSIYNVIWPAGAAVVASIEGTILKYWIAGLFLIPAILHLCSLVVLVLTSRGAPTESVDIQAVPHPVPERELLRKRQLALWLSRTALPATYTVIYGLMPMMPSLPVMRNLPTTLETVVGSVWLTTRLLAFIILAFGSWWHTRPRALLWAAIVMGVAFFGMTLRPTGGASPSIDLISMIAWQAVLGLAIGMIYSGSLYFGMVLSEGSTEHGGYHEALIGVGWILGPAAGVGAQQLRPDSVWMGIAAVGSVIGVSVLAVIVTALVLGRTSGRKSSI